MSSPSPRAGTRGLVIGHIGQAPVVIAPSWLIAAVVITVLFAPTLSLLAPSLGAGAYLIAFAFAILLFASVLAHEVSHAVVARAKGADVKELVITVWGGHTTYAAQRDDPGVNALVAVVGPLSNILLAGVFLGVWALLPESTPRLVQWLVLSGAYSNGFVAVFNLIPGLPLDGGQIFQALVWKFSGSRTTGTLVAGWAGRILAVVVVVGTLAWSMNTGGSGQFITVAWGLLIGSYLWMGATGAMRGAEHNRRLGELRLDNLAQAAYPVASTATLGQLDQTSFARPQGVAVLVDPHGQPVGYVQQAAADSVTPAMRSTTPLSAVAVPLPPEAWVSQGLTGTDLAHAIGVASQRSPVVVVVSGQGQVCGLVHVNDVINALRGSR